MRKHRRLGIIGLGRLWRHAYRPALMVHRTSYQVVGLHDPIRGRLERERAETGFPVMASVTALCEVDATDAILVLDSSWQGVWPALQAVRAGRPVVIAGLAVLQDPRAAELVDEAAAREVPVHVALSGPFTPAVSRLQELLAGSLGPAQRIMVRVAGQSGWNALAAVRSLSTAEPTEHHRLEMDGVLSLHLSSDEGPTVVVTRWPSPRPGSMTVEVVADHGTATAQLPRRVHWRTAEGLQSVIAPRGRSSAAGLLERWAQGQSIGPTLAEALRWRQWLFGY